MSLAQPSPEERSDRTLLVRWIDPDAARDAMRETPPLLRALGGRVTWVARAVPGLAEIVVPVGTVDVAQSILARQEEFAFVAFDHVLRTTSVPNDSCWGTQWNMVKCCFPSAWDHMVQADVLIGHLDSGVQYTHPDLNSNIEYNLAELGNDEDNSGIIGDYWGASMLKPDDSCYLGGAGDPSDCSGHGTVTASVIGATGNNASSLPNGSWLAGGAWKCRILPVKILGEQTGLESAAIQGMDYAYAGRGVRLMNCSWVVATLDSPPIALKEFITETPNALYVFGAANATIDLDGPHLPPCKEHYYPQEFEIENMLVIGASNAADEMWGAIFGDECHHEVGSNWGHVSVDLFAPGELVPVLKPSVSPQSNCNDGGGIELTSGTSEAAPLVTAAAALVWTQNPSFTSLQVKERIMSTVDLIPALAGRCLTGYPTCGGRLNVAKALGYPTCNPVTCNP